MARILVIDDDETFSYVLKRACSRQGHEVMLSASACEAKEASAGMFDIVFLDISLPDGNGLSLLPLLLGSEGHPEVIVITGHDNRDWLEQALMAGAWDFIRKDDSLDTVFAALEQALLYHQNRCGAQLSSSGQRTTPLKRNRLVGSGAAIGRCLESVIQCADSDVCVLLSGETGTGKEVFARTIHENSGRQNGPFIVVDCAALPENLAESLLFGHVRGAFTGAITRENGLIPEADGGTLFLDEVGELSLLTQAKLLRVLQERCFERLGGTESLSVDVRIITATNRDLARMVEEGTFRRDLYYRLNVFPIHMPPLRERQNDIQPLAAYFVDKYAAANGRSGIRISLAVMDMLQRYSWPGNIRELENVMERAVLLVGQDGLILPQHLPRELHSTHCPFGPEAHKGPVEPYTASGTLQDRLDELERACITDALARHKGHMGHAAQALGLTERVMALRMKKHGISYKDFRQH